MDMHCLVLISCCWLLKKTFVITTNLTNPESASEFDDTDTDSTHISIVTDMSFINIKLNMIKWLSNPPLYFKVFVTCEFNSDLRVIFTESLKLVWKNAREVLWHYLKSFKNCGKFLLGDGFSWPKVWLRKLSHARVLKRVLMHQIPLISWKIILKISSLNKFIFLLFRILYNAPKTVWESSDRKVKQIGHLYCKSFFSEKKVKLLIFINTQAAIDRCFM